MLAVGVGDEDLTELLASDELHDLFDAAGIELVEDVVEQQDGGAASIGAFEEVELCKFQCNNEGFVLSLTAFSFDGMPAKGEDEVIAMDTVE